MNRRDLFTSGPAALVVVASPAEATKSPMTPEEAAASLQSELESTLPDGFWLLGFNCLVMPDRDPVVFARARSLREVAVYDRAEGWLIKDGLAETPVMALYREWEALYLFLNSREAVTLLSDADFDSACDVRADLARKMLDTPSQGPKDFIAKMLADSNHGENELVTPERDPAFWAEARSLIG